MDGEALTMWEAIARRIGEATGRAFEPAATVRLGGGSISAAWRLEGDGRAFFVKTGAAGEALMFEAEAEGLAELAAAASLRVPRVICQGGSDEAAFLVTEYVALRAGGGEARCGERLAQLHRHTSASFGWHRDNWIGSTPQLNAPGDDWVAFFRDQRLGYQLQLAERRGYGGALPRKGERLLADIGAFFGGYRPLASLLHGDLWAGNVAADEAGEPVVFDPAVYYGDREADLAMTELFGGFSRGFYDAYAAAWALDDGYGIRKTLYNLYHVLNHLNLFGGSYADQADRMFDALLAEIGA